MTTLERRYLRLLSAYPSDYRRSRGAEIVGTYLDLAKPGQRWPSPGDVADLMRGGLRQRLRAAGLLDLIPGVRLASVVALLVATTLAAIWWVAELRPAPPEWNIPHVGPLASPGFIAWTAWLVAAIAVALSPGRATRAAVGVALVLTIATVPAGAMTGLPRPPLFILLPQATLGALALLLPERLSPSIRIGTPLAAVGAGGTTAYLAAHHALDGYYAASTARFLPTAAGLLMAVALLLALGLALHRDNRGIWALLVLLAPVGQLALHKLAGTVSPYRGSPSVEFGTLAAYAILVSLLGPALLMLGIAGRRRAITNGRGERRPTRRSLHRHMFRL
ncbi:hypothetical protein [Micromonospora chalcea]|uniref:hypothetical protein n=1 Tax=Micromonospora chalcea TaxID=1874 RepID=UPI00157C44DE|nr:hypothetical protein [Micromonospora chalcea]